MRLMWWRTYGIALAACLAGAGCATSTSAPKPAATSSSPPVLNSFACPNPPTCLLGETPYVRPATAFILRTTGSRKTWQGVGYSALPNASLTDISCATTTACYAASLHHVCNANGGECNQVASPGVLTTNGGTTWITTPAPPALIARLSCPAPAVCYGIAGETGAAHFIERSGDRTKTWKRVFPTGDLLASSLTDLSCPSVTTCYATAAAWNMKTHSLSHLAVLVTDNAGKTWTERRRVDALAPSPVGTTGPPVNRALTSVSCVSVTTCYVLAAAFYPVKIDPRSAPQSGAHVALLVTSDSGTTWTRKSVPNMKAGDSPQDFTPPLACPSITTCYLLLSNGFTFDVASTGAVLVTHDGGESWHRTLVQASARLTDLACAKAHACRVDGPDGIFATVDGGTTWQRQVMADRTPVSQLSSIACPAADTCYAVG